MSTIDQICYALYGIPIGFHKNQTAQNYSHTITRQ